MYLHIGRDIIVPFNEVIAIVDYETIKKSEISKEFVDIAEYEGLLEKKIEEEIVKSCVITDKKVYLSSISTETLVRRGSKKII